ncbi:MAG: bifunctional metallophosphatase/5'-nucleotidase [Pseudotabrizicola sp.]|uniref:bifunctional metallophosphatase/5'-nucleotidase n=1 Tax=Pseudotabrizicola sp. TaxID=2939647 RepID=UPI0027226EE6|nr:bifunctional metallophosphatase/5'-nucleotidase [Pseudotabrizicola sp.]MDO8884573.1 bifunctional metallophosphatase/5'-nucleotidase [Pseudotabrizicola sp.]MDP2082996.1 bifunctional metallophosphatase/5'-nucleotidase [Pseudotabrizicola sp.]MDZ7574528.1 bifunctional metallophosphatase/5'-nucleotidase [Pseudotabrizicola sp.]
MKNHLLGTAAVITLWAGAAQADYTLHVLHINDLHSRIEAVNAFDSTCSAEDAAENKCFGGIARLATKVNELRDSLTAAGQNVIFVDAGDQFQGSLMFTTYRGAVEAEFLEQLKPDAMALGNHEFDDGPEGLADFLDKVTFPVISGNVDVSQSNVLAGRVQNHVVLDIGGEKIGIISALATDTTETSSPGNTVIFQDEIDSLKADVATLEAEGVTKIIAVTHVGYNRDQEIAAMVPGIDAVVGGHSHTYLSATDPKRAGPYPTWVSQESGAMVPVVQAYAYSKYLGHLELTFADDGTLLHAGGNTILLDASVIPDPAIEARVAELAGPIEELKAKIIGETSEAIDGSRETCRQGECQMGNLVTDAMLDRVQGQGVTIAITNGGGLRASIDAGPVSMGEALGVLPFQNTLSTFTVTGATIVAALENGVSGLEDGAGRFAQVAGMKYTFDPAQPAGSRVSDVMVGSGDDWAPIDLAADYNLVSNNYMRGGGDGYRMFVSASNAYDFGPDLADVLADYLAKTQSYTPYVDGRITRK